MVGAAFIDLNTRTLNVCEFIDDDHLSNVYVGHLYHAQDALKRLWTDADATHLCTMPRPQ
jgi:hypothetical protein